MHLCEERAAESNSNKLPDYLLTSKSTFFSITCESNILAQDHEDRAEPGQRLYRLLLNAIQCNLAQTRVHAHCLPNWQFEFLCVCDQLVFNYFFWHTFIFVALHKKCLCIHQWQWLGIFGSLFLLHLCHRCRWAVPYLQRRKCSIMLELR